MSVSDKEISAVSVLSREDRLSYLIKRVANFYEVWAIDDNVGGWVMAATKEEEPVFQIWPFAEYAALCCTGQWADCAPKSIGMDEFLESYLADFEEQGILIGAFYTPAENGLLIEPNKLRALLDDELLKYEWHD